MECPKCHAENTENSRFCSNCATPLRQAVPDDVSLTKTLERPTQIIKTGSLVAGKYTVVDEVGAGGMGIVYKAEDLKLKRSVALKFLPPHLSDFAELKERFLIEARAAAALSHPNICVIHEVGESEERPYIAMEYVEGETLRDRIKRSSLKPEEALDIAIQVASGLGEAHRKGIVHRDIKSANIMVTAKGQAKVMDFGLAKLQEGSSLTKSQTTLGTVAYMSPEQARGDELDQRTDLWSLGVVLYEMLTGDLPFKGDRDLSIIHSIIHEDPRPIKTCKPPVPLELQRVVARALKKDPAARYISAEDALKDLRKYKEALQAEAASVFNLRSLARRLRRPVVAIPAALAVIGVAVAAIWFLDRQAQIRWAREEALPEIARMVEGNDVMRNLVPPYRLAVKTEKVLGNDPKLAELFSKCSLNINIKTDPSGARVSMKEYISPEAEWSYLGTTPLENVRVPVGVFRWKFEKDGYETVLAASSTWDVDTHDPNLVVPYDLFRTLDAGGSLPPGMVRVQGAQTGRGKLEDFFIDRFEVTNRQFKGFIDAGGYRNKELWKYPLVHDGRKLAWGEAMKRFVDQTNLPGPATWSAGDYPEGEGDHPVSGVSWYEAAAYAEWAGKSLPSSVHWGTARGQETPWIRVFQLGGYALLAPFSNFRGKGPVPVGSLSDFTTFGAFDMAGNVREWCSNETPVGRIIRGGAWSDNTYEFGNRRQAPAIDRSPRNGFRCALYPNPERIPATALQFENLVEPGDPRQTTPVPDPIFKIYKEQFSYDRTDLEARVESSVENPEGWIHETVSFSAAYGGERVLGHLFLPKNASPPHQVVVYFPGGASAVEPSSREIESYYEFPMFVSFLVKNGRAVLYPVYKGTFERRDPSLTRIHLGADSHAYTDFLIQLVKDFKRCIDYLEARPDIDGGKIAYYGMSWGGVLGAIIPAVEDRLAASVVCAGGFARRPVRLEADPINYVTRIRTPTLMLNGRYDSIFDLELGVKPMFELLGTPAEHKKLMLYDTDHIPPRNDYVKETLAWLDKYLGPVKRE